MKAKLVSSHKVAIRGHGGILSEHFTSTSLEVELNGKMTPAKTAQLLRQKALLDLDTIYTASVAAGAPIDQVHEELKRFAQWSKSRIEKALAGETNFIIDDLEVAGE